MRAVVIDRFGGPDELHVSSVDEPRLAPDGLLVRVTAAGVNPVDTKLRAGVQESRFPFIFPCVLGWDVAGTVEAVGPAVVDFAPGDEVLAYCRQDFVGQGAYAELVAISDRVAARRPGSLDVVAGGGLPLAGLTAYQALLDALDIKAGETVAVRGASGGVGLFAVQIARSRGARVVAVASGGSEELVRSLGAAEFVDYSTAGAPERLRSLGPSALLDLAGGDDLDEWAGAVRDGGRVASVLAPDLDDARWADRGVRGRYVFVRPNGKQLADLVSMVAGGAVRVIVAETLELADAAEAHRRLEAGGVHGKLVLTA